MPSRVPGAVLGVPCCAVRGSSSCHTSRGVCCSRSCCPGWGCCLPGSLQPPGPRETTEAALCPHRLPLPGALLSRALAGRGGSWLAVTLGAGEPGWHSWEPREPDWQVQLQPMAGRPARAARVEFHSCCLRTFSSSLCGASVLCLWDWTGERTDGVLASRTVGLGFRLQC